MRVRLGLAIARHAAVGFVIVVLGLVLLEAALRLAKRDPVFINPLNSFHVGDPVLGWVGAPNHAGRFARSEFDVEIVNGPDGFRASGASVVPRADAVRLTFLGDSFTWGWGVGQGEVFTDPLQDRLGVGFRVENRGVNAWGTVQQALLLEQLMSREPPEWVFVMMFRNDLSNNVDGKRGRRPYIEMGAGGGTWRAPTRPLGGVWRDLRRRSAALTLYAEGWNRIRERIRKRDRGSASHPRAPASPQELRAFELALARMQAVCGSRCQLTLVHVPDAESVLGDPPHLESIRRVADRLGVDFFDLGSTFATADRSLFFRQDRHWNAAGHRVAADALAALVLDRYTVERAR